MSYLLHISTSVPEYETSGDALSDFYAEMVGKEGPDRFQQKLRLLARKSKISRRFSCIPDFSGKGRGLFMDGNPPSVEQRMSVYREKIVPLACEALSQLFSETSCQAQEITHLIAVSCTGLLAPGLEFLVAEKLGLQNTEKSGVYFLGCYAALKALKQADLIAQNDPYACVAVVCAELCSLHFQPSVNDEEIISNLLFSDGAAAMLVCGEKHHLAKNRSVLQINSTGSAFIPGTSDLMKWDIGSLNFKMHLNPAVVSAIRNNMSSAVNRFLGHTGVKVNRWAIHPGGAKIVEAVQQSLNLTDEEVEDSLSVLDQFGNMSSPTVLFVLKQILQKLKSGDASSEDKVFACAFGPGLNVEMVSCSVVNVGQPGSLYETPIENVVEL